jgi:hypothetical protein
MISIRRLIASMLAGALLVLVSAAQASAQPAPSIDRAVEGVALGLAAASEVAGDGDVIVLDEGLIKSLAAIDAWFARHTDSNGQGPLNAKQVHEYLLDDQIPGQMRQNSGSKLSALADAYEVLKGKSDEAKQAKDAKDKSNNGKSDDKSNNGKSDDNSSSEASRGQQNRP